MFFGCGVEFLIRKNGEGLHLLRDLAHVPHRMHHVASAGFALGADHGRAFGDAAESFSQVARATHKRRGEGVLVDVVRFIAGVSTSLSSMKSTPSCLQNLRFGEVTDTGLGHDWNRNGADDFLNELRAGHAGNAALARIMAGTRSRAMTETAAGSSAMRACSTFITSMMTRP